MNCYVVVPQVWPVLAGTDGTPPPAVKISEAGPGHHWERWLRGQAEERAVKGKPTSSGEAKSGADRAAQEGWVGHPEPMLNDDARLPKQELPTQHRNTT
ncbi:hypothetical protein [Pseudoxanthomonas dokdonensis]|uniref:Uncharacterized protein n=1 Tax=Pseudoxanthomonas dokdonensis TaxID=344882 RepID=A0A0R0CIL0_9GAMM|nr:hypothetical protein [Pseudoxanthomonas dokdonensis]KRG69328.1 hypothetical protein ABB29_09485 [Pseudoxanthomonas dokdonensis]